MMNLSVQKGKHLVLLLLLLEVFIYGYISEVQYDAIWLVEAHTHLLYCKCFVAVATIDFVSLNQVAQLYLSIFQLYRELDYINQWHNTSCMLENIFIHLSKSEVKAHFMTLNLTVELLTDV